jgi:hypothetical protein
VSAKRRAEYHRGTVTGLAQRAAARGWQPGKKADVSVTAARQVGDCQTASLLVVHKHSPDVSPSQVAIDQDDSGKLLNCRQQTIVAEAGAARQKAVHALFFQRFEDGLFPLGVLFGIAQKDVVALGVVSVFDRMGSIGKKKGLKMSGTTKQKAPVRWVARPRAMPLGR